MTSERLPSSESESALEPARREDKKALGLLFTAHQAYLRQVIALRMDDAVRVRVDPSDVVQETLLEAARQFVDYAQDPKLPVRLWLRHIAVQRLAMAGRRHVGADKRSIRRQVALPEQSSVSLARRLVGRGPSPSRDAMRNELAGKVREALAQLAENDREIILLQAFEGLTSSEAGLVLDIEPAAARKRYGRALLRLKQRLIENGVGDSMP